MADYYNSRGVIDLSTDRTYCLFDKGCLSFQVFASVDQERRLKAFFSTESDNAAKSAVLRGTPHFQKALGHLSGQFDSILAQWTPEFPSNLDAFNRAVLNGMSKEEAALTATWTGHRAGEAGYSEVVVLAAVPEEGPPFVDVEINFRRPYPDDQTAATANVTQVEASTDRSSKLPAHETELLTTWSDLLADRLAAVQEELFVTSTSVRFSPCGAPLKVLVK
jgi:hypothetical protein